MEKGKIIHSVAGTYLVLLINKKIINCKPRGRLRLEDIRPLTGDEVLISYGGNDDGIIEEILPRKNHITRPPIANIDQMIAVIAPNPAPNFALFDRILITGEQLKIKIVIVVNKIDLGDTEEILSYYNKTPYNIIELSAKSGQGIDEFKEVLGHNVSVLAGQSGVGKSSIINFIKPHLKIATQAISERRGFGRHTTRTVSLIDVGNEGLLADTPGFNRLDINKIKSEDLQWYYPEMDDFIGKCRFRNCLHKNEPKCAVKEAASNNIINLERYQSYLTILEELIESEKRLYEWLKSVHLY